MPLTESGGFDKTLAAFMLLICFLKVKRVDSP